ncbi:MAG: MATE family efflux transporter [Lachnospiraceae bacterium]|nr:MATE family efflux transporter [Lachnospiraceae bacterium]
MTETVKRGPRGVLNMTEGNPYKMIIRFALPVLLSQVFQQLYNTADTYIVGKFLGTGALAAVSSSGTLIFLITSLFIGFAMGAGVAISRFFGAGDNEKVSKAIHTKVAIGLISSVILTVIGVIFTPTFLRWMNTTEEVMPLAVQYFRYYFWGIITNMMYNILKGVLNSVGDSKRPLYYLIFSSLFNIGLDTLFVGVFHWGVWSAAVATVISQGVSCILCLVHLMQKGHVYTLEIKKIRIDMEMLKLIIKYGIPSGVSNSVIAFANVMVQTQINTFGYQAMAAFGTYSKIEGFAFLPIMSFTLAITTFVGQNLGAGLKDRAKKGSTFGIITAVVMAEIIGLIFYFLAPFLIALFDPTPEVVAMGVTQARTEALFYCMLAFSHTVAAVCRGAGKAFVPMFVQLGIWCAFRIGYILVIMHTLGEIRYVYTAYPVTWSITSIIFLIYFLKSNWVNGFDKKELSQ